MKKNLAVIEEIDLEKFVAESEHYSMSCFEPLLDIDKAVITFELAFLDLHFLYLLVEVNDESLQK